LMDDQSEQSSSDDDFMPLCEIKKRFSKKNDGKKSRRRKKKKLDPMDMNEMDCDDDELDDSDHEHVKKERKMATEETLCKHCAKSSNPEVVSGCDVLLKF
uniref:ATRX n=1 Tax=Anisakis simplex TaxID=6269 RepID=A0A0M3JFG2_ANISI